MEKPGPVSLTHLEDGVKSDTATPSIEVSFSVFSVRLKFRRLTDQVDQHQQFDPQETKRLLRRIDLRLLPLLTVLYILSFMDRSNIGNARVAGMNDDLGLTGPQYNMALTVFFFPYALFEVPSNIVLKIMKPSHWIAILVVTWGTVCLVPLVSLVKADVLAAGIGSDPPRYCQDLRAADCYSLPSRVCRSWFLPCCNLPVDHMVLPLGIPNPSCDFLFCSLDGW